MLSRPGRLGFKEFSRPKGTKHKTYQVTPKTLEKVAFIKANHLKNSRKL